MPPGNRQFAQLETAMGTNMPHDIAYDAHGQKLGVLQMPGEAIANISFFTNLENLEFQEVDQETGLTLGKPFDALAPGTFKPGNYGGRTVTFKADEMAEYVANTQRAIASSVTDSGELVGLPIDAAGHDPNSGAAGWIVSAELANTPKGQVIRLTPLWTELGVKQIQTKTFRFFSGTIDQVKKIIWGGTLTNWPAVRDEKGGRMILAPIEMSNQMIVPDLQGHQLAEFDAGNDPEKDESLEHKSIRVEDAFYKALAGMDDDDARWDFHPWYLQTYDDHVIIAAGGKLFKVAYQETDEGFQFAPEQDWVEVRSVFVEASSLLGQITQRWQSFKQLFNKSKKPDGGEHITDTTQDDPPGENQDQEDETPKLQIGEMNMDLTAFETIFPRLENETDAAYEARLRALVPAAASLAGVDVSQLGAAFDGSFDHLVDALVDQREAQLEQTVNNRLAALQWKRQCTEFAANITQGAAGYKGVLPIAQGDIEELLSRLQQEDSQVVMEILETIAKHGLRQFNERGHARELQPKQALDSKMATLLQKHLETPGATIKQWFEINAEDVGSMGDYDLTEFESEKE